MYSSSKSIKFIAKSITPLSLGSLKERGALLILFKGKNVARPAFALFKTSMAILAVSSSSTTTLAILPPIATSNAVEYSLSTCPSCARVA